MASYEPAPGGAAPDEPGVDITVAELLVRFMRHAKTYYQASNEAEHFA